MKMHFRPFVVLALVALAAAAVAVLAGSTKSVGAGAREGSEHQGLAFRHHEDLFSAKGTGDKEGPASYADQVAQLNAFPNDTITPAEIAGAQAANAALAKKGVGQGKNSTTSWYSLGPTDAVYPAVLNRHGSRYVTSGRITALAIKPGCDQNSCTVWVGAAGGGVWRTDKALSGHPNWANVSDGFFASGAIGALTYDAGTHTLYTGTGEDAAAGDAEAGLGIYKSTDDGDTWTALGGNANFLNRAIRQITVDPAHPNVIYVADGRGVHGYSATTAGAVSQIPGAPGVGVWKSTDGGATFTLLQPVIVSLGPNPGQTFPSSFGSSRGATDVELDPTHAGVVYASAYNVGVWRSTDDGATWTNIHPCDPAITTCGFGADRSEFALATGADGHTRMYQTEGDSGPPANGTHPERYSRFFIAQAVESGSPSFVDKTSSNPANVGYDTYDLCTGQCWYDEGVYSPPENPDLVYVFGSYVYGEAGGISNARAVLLSQDGGNTFTDLTEDGTPNNPNGLHPDQHALVTVPGKPLLFFEGSDGGLMRSDGTLVDTSSRCSSRGLGATALARCQQLLSAVPGQLVNLNEGLQTLQFQSLSVNPANSKNIQGGTQDNGTFETNGSSVVWPQTIFGDGGLSGFDATDSHFRFHTYYYQQVDVSFADGAPTSWDWVSDPLFAVDPLSLFYFPIISDPTVSGTIFAGITHVWRTQDNGGPRDYLDQHCNEFTGDFTVQCGDFVPVGGLTLTGTGRGPVHPGGSVSWLQRTSSDGGTLWAGTSTCRLFISHNADASPATVTFTQLDSLAANAPGRAISSISVDPANSNHAYVSYLGYNASTPATPGHIFSVTYDPIAGTATWTRLDHDSDLGDQPANAVALDNVKGDLYAATDFGVLKLASGSSSWAQAAAGLPIVTVSGLTIDPGARQLLAATHGRGAYQLTLP